MGFLEDSVRRSPRRWATSGKLTGRTVNGDAFNATFNKPSQTMIGTIVSLFDIGAFCGAVATSTFGERLGRRRTIAVGVVIMIIGALLQSTAYARAHLLVARIVSGVGLGVINSTTPVFQSEFSPKANRGLYVCMQISTLNFGIALVYWIDYGFSFHKGSYAWRIPVILQCVFLIPMLILIWILVVSLGSFAVKLDLSPQDKPMDSIQPLLSSWENFLQPNLSKSHPRGGKTLPLKFFDDD